MTPKKRNKLSLNRETIRTLSASQLKIVIGGATAASCSGTEYGATFASCSGGLAGLTRTCPTGKL